MTKPIEQALDDFKAGKLSKDALMKMLKHLPFEDLGYAKVDHHRALRTGFPEVVFCEGKSTEQVVGIYQAMEQRGSNILLTRANGEIYEAIAALNPKVVYNQTARIVVYEQNPLEKKGKVNVICAGTSDMPVAEEAALTAEISGSNVRRIYDVGVAGLHRLLAHLDAIFDANCIVCLAGMDGALPSVVGGLAPCPVIAVPTSVGYGTNLGGIAPLLTMLNSCAPNVTVVNIDNGFGAGYIASLIVRQ